ncbi:hypothetical protein GCM10029964_072160 [Kibdelosporangium lantanae]
MDVSAGTFHGSYSPGVMTSESPTPTGRPRISADWAAVAVAGVLVLLAALGVLPTITFLVK